MAEILLHPDLYTLWPGNCRVMGFLSGLTCSRCCEILSESFNHDGGNVFKFMVLFMRPCMEGLIASGVYEESYLNVSISLRE